MLHSLNPLQDENSQPYLTNKRLANDTNRKLLGPAGNTPLSKQAGLSSARKALGNITNRATQQQENATPFKNTPAVPGHRKALGDITNASIAGTGLASRPQPEKQAQQKSCAAKPRLSKHKSKAEIYAKDGVERLAGRSRSQLDADRELRDMQDASSRAAHIASLCALHPPMMKCSKGVFDDLSNLELEVMEAPLSPKPQHDTTDDLLQAESPDSLLAEASSRELDVLSDCEEDYAEEKP
ncbi:hypothetical protein ABBQ38_003161 [Trebouxia sp. C0009 RCD-2024]